MSYSSAVTVKRGPDDAGSGWTSEGPDGRYER